MSPRLDLPIAVLVWLVGFACVRAFGTWLPLAVLTVMAAARLVAGDAGTRELLRLRVGRLALGAAAGAAMVAGTYVLYRPMSLVVPALDASTRELYDMLRAVGLAPLPRAALLLLVSASEEIVWRGRSLGVAASTASGPLGEPAVSRAAAVALLYGAAMMASGSLLLAFVGVGCGLAWGLLRVGGRSLYPSIVAHATWDLAVLVAWPLH